MPKMKSSRTLAKRIKVTGTGKIKRKKAGNAHFAPRKTRKQRKHLAKRTLVHETDVQRISDMIYKGK